MAHVEEIRAQRQMRPMLFENAERQQTRAFGKLDGVAKLRGSQLFPFRGEFGLRVDGTNGDESYEQRTDSGALH